MAEWCERDPKVEVRKLRGREYEFHITWAGAATLETLEALPLPQGTIRRGTRDYFMDLASPAFPWTVKLEAFDLSSGQPVLYHSQAVGTVFHPLPPHREPLRMTVDLP